MIKDDAQRYGWLTITLHWLSALLVIAIFGIGFYMVDLSYYDDGYHELPKLHVSLGLLLAMLLIVRIAWRVSQRGKPMPLPSHSRPIRLAAASMKHLLYLLMTVMIVTGYLINTAKGDPARFFELFGIPATWRLDSDGVDLAGEIHELAAWSLIGLAAAHAGAALWHHFVIRDRTLRRMLRPGKPDLFR
ncbi:MAG: cytochrome b [Natronospirillum sp.]